MADKIPNNKRINGNALEMIMRDVLAGMEEFTCDVCRNSQTGGLEIIALEQHCEVNETVAAVIPFARQRPRRKY